MTMLTSSDTKLIILADGKVGIGTTNPTNQFQIGDSVAAVGTGNHIAFSNGTKACAFFQSNTFTNIYTSIAYKFWVSGTEAITIDSSRNVGIGTASPTTLTELYQGSTTNPTELQITNFSAGDAFINFIERDATGNTNGTKFGEANAWGFQVGYDGGDNKFFIKSGNQETVVNRLTIQRDDGKVGIGTDDFTAGGKLQVYNGIVMLNQSAASNYYLIHLKGPVASFLGGSRFFDAHSYNSAGSAEVARTWFTHSSEGIFGIAHSASGTPAIRLVIATDGQVGIGTTDPDQLLHVRKDQNTDTLIKVQNNTAGTIARAGLWLASNSNNAYVIVADDGYTAVADWADTLILNSNAGAGIRFACDSATKMAILADGNVGVGEASPDMRLHVKNTIDTAYSVTNVVLEAKNLFKLENASTTANAFAGMQFRIGSGCDLFFGAEQKTGNDGDFYFANQGSPSTEMMRIKSDGKVGIGTNAPNARLEVEDGGTASSVILKVTADDQSPYALMVGNDTYSTTDTDGIGMWINNAGQGKLHARGTGSQLILGAAGTNYVYLLSDGKVGIGTTNPTSLFHVNGASLLGGTTTIGGNLMPTIGSLMDIGTSSVKWRNLALSGTADVGGALTGTTAAFSGRVTAGDFEMLDLGGTGRTLAVRDGSSNTVKIGDGTTFSTFRFNATQVAPQNNNTCILGASSLRWSTIYGVLGNFSGAVTIGSYTLPTADGTAGYHLQTDGAGAVTWQPGGAGTVTGTGTANYVSKWTGTNSQGNSSIFDNNSQVTIDVPVGVVAGSGSGTLTGRLQIGSTTSTANNSLVFWRGAKPTLAANQGAILYESGGMSDGEGMTFMSDKGYKFLDDAGTTEWVRIKSDGNVGIGTTNPSQPLHVNGASLLGGTTTIGGNLVGAISGLFDLGTGSFKWRNLALSGTADIGGEVDASYGLDWALSQTIKGRLGYGTGFVYVGSNTAAGILKLVSGNGATACTFAANQDATFTGKVGIGTGPAATLHTFVDGGPNEFRMQAHRNDVGQNMFSTQFSRGSAASPAIVQNGDTLLEIQPKGYDGANYHRAAEIDFQVDGTPGTNDMPGRIVFWTTADGASAPTERMRIASTGKISIGNNIPMWSGSYGGALVLKGNNATADRYAQLGIVDSTGTLVTTGLVVANSGNVGIGTVSPGLPLEVKTSGSASTQYALSLTNPNNQAGDGGGAGIRFSTSGGPGAAGNEANKYSSIEAFDVNNWGSNSGLSFTTSLSYTKTKSMVIDRNGNVGIGTTNPGSYKLKVEGTTWLNDQAFIAGNNTAPPTTSNSQDFGAIRMSDGGLRSMYQGCTATYGWVQVSKSTNHSVNYPLALNPNGGDVGIGIATPGAKVRCSRG